MTTLLIKNGVKLLIEAKLIDAFFKLHSEVPALSSIMINLQRDIMG